MEDLELIPTFGLVLSSCSILKSKEASLQFIQGRKMDILQ